MTSKKSKTHAEPAGAIQQQNGLGGFDVVVMLAMAAVSIALGLAMHLQAGMGMVPSGSLGGAVFALFAIIHSLRRRVERLQSTVLMPSAERREPTLHEATPTNTVLDMASSQLAAAAAALRDVEPAPAARNGTQRRKVQPAVNAYEALSAAPPTAPRSDMDHGWSEAGDVDALVRQYAEELDRGRPPAELPRPNLPLVKAEPAARAARTAASPQAETESPLAAAIRKGAAGAVEIHLQPIVSFADRKARLYEVFPRLVDENGTILATEDYQTAAQSMGLALAVERSALLRCCAIQRNLSERGRARSMIFRLSSAAIRDRSFLQRLMAEIKPDPLLADLIVFEIDQAEIEQGDGVDRDNMDLLGQAGFRFSLGSAETLALELEELTMRRIGFVRVTAAVLNAEHNPAAVTDLRNGAVETILTDIASDEDVRLGSAFGLVLGQGLLFSGPKPLRADVAPPAATRATRAA